MEKTLQEYRLASGLTIQEASRASGVPENKIRRWEGSGASRAAAHEVYQLIQVYGITFAELDFSRVATKREIGYAILLGAITGNNLDIAVALNLMKAEGMNVDELLLRCEEAFDVASSNEPNTADELVEVARLHKQVPQEVSQAILLRGQGIPII